jgi:hypothetical protein
MSDTQLISDETRTNATVALQRAERCCQSLRDGFAHTAPALLAASRWADRLRSQLRSQR